MSQGSFTLVYDKQVTSIDAIQRAAYRFINFFVVDISFNEESIVCDLTAINDQSDETLKHKIQEFKNEVLDQHLRIKIKAETEAVRNLILGIAFSRTGLGSGEQI